jgi:polyisoprenoid-binding protein YceI
MKLVIGFLLILTSLTTTSVFAEAPVGEYVIDTAHTKIGFEVTHLVISTVEGRFTKFDGVLILDKKLSNSKVTANVQMSSVDTTDIDRDKHLKSADFFDADKFPLMTFVSDSFAGSNAKLKIKGKLTIKGISKEVTFDAKLSNEITDPWGKKRVAISGTTKVNRKDFGIVWGKIMEAGPVVGDEVIISIKAETIKK